LMVFVLKHPLLLAFFCHPSGCSSEYDPRDHRRYIWRRFCKTVYCCALGDYYSYCVGLDFYYSGNCLIGRPHLFDMWDSRLELKKNSPVRL
jgi:hypothetical protein